MVKAKEDTDERGFDGFSRIKINRGEGVMAQEELLLADVSNAIIRAFYHVYNTLGYGFLEKVYQKALVITLRKEGFGVETQVPQASGPRWTMASLIRFKAARLGSSSRPMMPAMPHID